MSIRDQFKLSNDKMPKTIDFENKKGKEVVSQRRRNLEKEIEKLQDYYTKMYSIGLACIRGELKYCGIAKNSELGKKNIEGAAKIAFILSYFNELKQYIDENGIYKHLDDKIKIEKEYLNDKEFAKKYISLYPMAYKLFSSDVQNDREVLLALAKSPVFYEEDSARKEKTYAISPLSALISEFDDRKQMLPDVCEAIRGQKPITENLPGDYTINNEIKISDPEIILCALQSELDSFDYIYEMEKMRTGPKDFGYEGIKVLLEARQFNTTFLDDYKDNLLCFKYAADELWENDEFVNRVKETILDWAAHKKVQQDRDTNNGTIGDSNSCMR